MSDEPEGLPDLVRLKDYDGNWDDYLDALYEFFKEDFVDSKPVFPLFERKRVGLKRQPMCQGKEATFWHFIQEGKVEADRIPDLR